MKRIFHITAKRLAFIGLGIALGIFSGTGYAQQGGGTNNCQTWVGDHYETRPCNFSAPPAKQPRGGDAEPVVPQKTPRERSREKDLEGKAFLDRGYLQPAFEKFNDALKFDINDSAAYFGFCLVLGRGGNPDYVEALHYCEKAAALDKEAISSVWGWDKDALNNKISHLKGEARRQKERQDFYLCNKNFEKMDFAGAASCLAGYLNHHPNADNRQLACQMKGTALTRLGKFAEAEEALHQSYLANPDAALSNITSRKHPNLADNLWDLEVSRALAIPDSGIDNTLKKITLFQMSLRFRPDDYRSLYWLAQEELKGAYYNMAFNHLDKAEKQWFAEKCPTCVSMTNDALRGPYPDRRPVPGAPYIGRLEDNGQSTAWYPPDIEGQKNEAFRIVNYDAQERLSKARNQVEKGIGTNKELDAAREQMARAYMQIGNHEKAYEIFSGLLGKYPQHPEYRHLKEVLSRIIVHKPIYNMEARRQAEMTKKNGQWSVLHEIDQNVKCIAGQTFDGNGSCINNGFRWPIVLGRE